ncbi:hypothetical protein FNV43_RR03424 [Rhamnella rubrinervis]|uniref:RNase H type-1 domain-containing protein n=1 Tax=Rhamnella rubrinervis TaxID=2594499 RepID=A0A8K0MNP4_9ROSA|nr:hypothetical protein FNV43_RR03424 [Rhamnella rubrinervis]
MSTILCCRYRMLRARLAWFSSRLRQLHREFHITISQTQGKQEPKELEGSTQTQKGSTAKTQKEPWWLAPSNGYLKLNVDGGYQYHTSKMKSGGVISDENGDWVDGFIANTGKLGGYANPTLAEVYGLLYGLKLAEIRRHKIEMDNKGIVSDLHKKNSGQGTGGVDSGQWPRHKGKWTRHEGKWTSELYTPTNSELNTQTNSC